MSLKKNDFFYFKPIKSARISIRELDYSDDFAILELFSNPNVTKYLSFNHFSMLEDAKLLIKRAINQYKNEKIFYLGIIHNDEQKLIGYIGLSRYDLSKTTCQVVYALNEKYWHKGLMVDALKLFISYLFNDLNKQIIIATHIDVNKTSGRVMEKAGMERDRNYDQQMIIKGKTEKLIGYSITKE